MSGLFGSQMLRAINGTLAIAHRTMNEALHTGRLPPAMVWVGSAGSVLTFDVSEVFGQSVESLGEQLRSIAANVDARWLVSMLPVPATVDGEACEAVVFQIEVSGQSIASSISIVKDRLLMGSVPNGCVVMVPPPYALNHLRHLLPGAVQSLN